MSHITVEVYLHTYNQLHQAIEGLSTEQLRWKAAPEKWSITEVLTHLADHNIVVSFRIRKILASTDGQLPAFDQDPWVAGQLANESKAEDILNVFRALLIYNSLLFQRLSLQDWEKTGVNFQGITVSLADIIQSFVKHVQTHLGQISRIIQEEAQSRNSNSVI